MAHIIAKNQTLVCFGAGPVTIYSDPIAIATNDRLSCMAIVHDIDTNSALGAPQLVYTAQVSNDGGQNYVNSAVTATLTAAGVFSIVGAMNGALLRFKFAFSSPAATGTDVSAVCFDMYVEMDHA